MAALLALLLCVALVSGFGKSKTESLVPVSGKIFDAATHKPLTGVEVSRKDTRVYSGKDGSYRILVPTGIREIAFRFGERASFHKSAILRSASQPVNLDALCPLTGNPNDRRRLLTERGSNATREGSELSSDYAGDSMLSLTDSFGNDPVFLKLGLGGFRAHSPVFKATAPDGQILLAVEGVVHTKQRIQLLGLYQYELKSQHPVRVASGQPLLFVDFNASTNAVVAATGHDIFLLDAKTGTLKSIHSETDGNFLLSVAWGPDGRIYFTVEEPVRVNASTSITRSRIASLKPDGSDVNSRWASDPNYSYRYPKTFGKELVYTRFTTDGREQSLLNRAPEEKEARLLIKDALRVVDYDRTTGRLYYVFKSDLHFRDLRSGFDAIIENSVDNGQLH